MTFDWKAPDYDDVFIARINRLRWLETASDAEVAELKAYYRDGHVADFINDWGTTFDPRNADVGLPTTVPFLLFPKQREFVDYVIDRWKNRQPGLCEKSRDCGVSWLAIGIACGLCLLIDGVVVGFGSRKSEYVDKPGEPKSLFWKARFFMSKLPPRLRGDWQEWRDAPHMRVNFPETGSHIGGEGGDDIGRGDRTSLYFIDEAAYLERPDLVERSLSQTTNCRIDVSSVRGMNNPFAKKRWGGGVKVFVFDWRDDPRKDAEWYRLLSAPESEGGKGLDEITIAQEVDRDYMASVSGVVIPAAWVRSCIDAVTRLGLQRTGKTALALDVADEGPDKNAVVGTTGVEVDFCEEWSGAGSDTFATVQRVFKLCEERGYAGFRYDSDGIGALVRGDSRVLNDQREARHQRRLVTEPFRGSEAVHDPDGIVEGTIGGDGERGRTNKDYFANRKAQGWWSLRQRVRRTHRWVTEGIACNTDDLFSISSACPGWQQLAAEISQPTYKENGVGKIVINKKPDGTASPNRGDAVMMRFAPNDAPPLAITEDVLAAIRAMPRRRR